MKTTQTERLMHAMGYDLGATLGINHWQEEQAYKSICECATTAEWTVAMSRYMVSKYAVVSQYRLIRRTASKRLLAAFRAGLAAGFNAHFRGTFCG